MSYFKRKAVRESLAELDTGEVVSIEDGVNETLLEIENDTLVINNMDNEAVIMDEDIEETETRLETVSEDTDEDLTDGEMEEIDVAQEHIRSRWGIRHRSVARESLGGYKTRRVVAREGLWEDIKAFFKKILDWFKEKLAQLKDRWLKFHNLGKSMQKKSKKFDAAIQKLGERDKDTISGSWIEYLTVNGVFVEDVSRIKVDSNASNALTGGAELSAGDMIATAEEELRKAKEGKGVGESNKGKDFKKLQEKGEKIRAAKAKVEAEAKDLLQDTINSTTSENVNLDKSEEINIHYPGNYLLHAKLAKDGASTVTFEKFDDVEVPSEVKTPTTSELNKINTVYNRAGIEIEKHILNWRKRERAQEALNKALDKVNAFLDKNEVGGESSNVISDMREMISILRMFRGATDKAEAHTIKCISKGLDGYLTAGIRAYKKKK